jgi:dihydrofolate reductase
MRKIIVMMSVSVDGFFEGPDRELDWHLVDDELHGHFNEQLAAMGAFLDGRITYELMAGFWPTADRDPASTPLMAEFAGIWRDMPKIVYSRTLQQADWNTTVVPEVVADEVMALKAQPGGDLVLGRGQPLFGPADAPIALRPAETRTFGNGVVLLRYQRP